MLLLLALRYLPRRRCTLHTRSRSRCCTSISPVSVPVAVDDTRSNPDIGRGDVPLPEVRFQGENPAPEVVYEVGGVDAVSGVEMRMVVQLL